MGKKYMLNPEKVRANAYNLKWTCPYCSYKNIEYYFNDWKYKSWFYCMGCAEVVYYEGKI